MSVETSVERIFQFDENVESICKKMWSYVKSLLMVIVEFNVPLDTV